MNPYLAPTRADLPAIAAWTAANARAVRAYADDMATQRGVCTVCKERPIPVRQRVCHRCHSRRHYGRKAAA